ncbi:MAG TPA: nuclear transport factor 2 family protein, partial [Vicinamibacterales bacterium]|nr:nuclear transport factor 2 family protein [Vicinamibacterales bacterium]
MSNLKLVAAFAGACVLSFMAGRIQFGATPVQAQERAFTALDYQEITQLINRYAYGIDTCANNGYDYADVFTPDGVFIDKNSDAGFKAGGR